MKFVISFGLLVFTGIYGIPTSEPTQDDSSVSETPRVKEWITFNPSWSFSSLSSISRLFNDKTDENSMILMNKRIEILEKSQKSIIKLIKKFIQGGANPLGIKNKSIRDEKLSLPSKAEEINNETLPQVKSTTPSTFEVPTTIDQFPIDINAMATLKDIQPETTVRAASEKPITNLFVKSVNASSGNNAGGESIKSRIEVPLNNNNHNNNKNSSVITKVVKFKEDEDINQTEIPNPLELGVHQPDNARINTKYSRNNETVKAV